MYCTYCSELEVEIEDRLVKRVAMYRVIDYLQYEYILQYLNSERDFQVHVFLHSMSAQYIIQQSVTK